MMCYVLSIILTLHWKVPDAQNEWNKREEEPFVMSVGLCTTCPFGHLMPWCPKGWQNVLAYAMRHLPAVSLADRVPALFHHLGIGLCIFAVTCLEEMLVAGSLKWSITYFPWHLEIWIQTLIWLDKWPCLLTPLSFTQENKTESKYFKDSGEDKVGSALWKCLGK